VLAYDITEIRPGQFKGPAFKKGYIVKEEDLEHLRRLGGLMMTEIYNELKRRLLKKLGEKGHSAKRCVLRPGP
jgi:transcriptional regulator of NAD metabolism